MSDPTTRVYRTETGSYAESELAVLVWFNSGRLNRPNSRLLETLTDYSSPHPMAFPIRSLQLSLPEPHPATESDLQERLLASTKQVPVIVPIPIARKALGWDEFYIPSAFEEPRP